MTPIHWLATLRRGIDDDHRKILKMLVQVGFDINRINETGYMPLHLACSNGKNRKNFLDLYLGIEPYGGDWTYVLPSYPTVIELVKLLVQEGADVNALSELGDTPLSLSCSLPMPAVMEYLLQAGADARFLLEQQFELEPTKQNFENLMWLLAYGIVDLAAIEEKKLLKYLTSMPEKHRPSLIHLLMELGYRFIDNDAFLDIIDPALVVQQPLSLQRVCANMIRKSLSPKLYTNLMKLGELPERLKQYILLK